MQRILLISFFWIIISTIGNAQNPNRSGRDYAYFFYIDNYQNRGWSDLPETKLECEKIARELRSNYGFYTEVIANPTKSKIKSKLLEVNKKSFNSNDQVLFFFSGHGHFKKETERGFFIPSDGQTLRNDPFSDTWLSYDDLGSYLTLNSCKHTLVALDACYSGSFGDRWKDGPGGLPWDSEDDCQVKEKKGLGYPSAFYVSSGNKNQKTPAKSKFASRFLEFLRNPQGENVLNEKNLRYYLSLIDFPQPEGGTFSAKHEEGGNFIFMKKEACSVEEKETDDSHWAALMQNRTERGLYQHEFMFPDCRHKKEIQQFIGEEKEAQTKVKDVPEANEEIKEPVTINTKKVDSNLNLKDQFKDYIEGYHTDKRDGNYYFIVKSKTGQQWLLDNIKIQSRFSEDGKFSFKDANRACPKKWRLPTLEEWAIFIETYPVLTHYTFYNENKYWVSKRKNENKNTISFNLFDGGYSFLNDEKLKHCKCVKK